MKRALCSILLLTLAAPAQADEALRERMQTAVTKGVKWLSGQQAPDGSWTYANAPMQLTKNLYPMPEGVTAFCAFALMKCGVKPNDPVINKAFAFMHKQTPRFTYAVGCTLLAIEARANFDPARQVVRAPGEDGNTQVRKKKRPRIGGADRKLAQRCVDFLVANQRQTGLWSYHGAGRWEDNSNTQYAMLGLDAAERLGLKVPRSVYEKAAHRLIDMQDTSTAIKVTPFSVPGADAAYRSLRKIQEKMLKSLRKAKKKLEKKDPQAYDDKRSTIERKASEEVQGTLQRGSRMHARGWAYMHRDMLAGQREWKKKVTGAMTASALAALFICKARLEGTSAYGKLSKKLVQSLRDGCAWIAHHYDIKANPPKQATHHFYWLYGLERAGVLGLVGRFGKHSWFSDGVHAVLDKQVGAGNWKLVASTSGPVPDTCFALLFLARGTTPVVRVPGRVVTGSSKKD